MGGEKVKGKFAWKGCFILLILFEACAGSKANNSSENFKVDADEVCFVKQDLISSDESIFSNENISFEIIQSDTLPTLLKINDAEYPINIDLESPSVNFWFYKCKERAVLFIEGDDYYGSTFFTYYMTNQELSYLGNILILQPNVEDEGVFEKEFKISNTDDQFEIVSFLNGNVYDTVVFKEIHPIQHN